jgi:hypothetical protein
MLANQHFMSVIRKTLTLLWLTQAFIAADGRSSKTTSGAAPIVNGAASSIKSTTQFLSPYCRAKVAEVASVENFAEPGPFD